MEKLGNMVPTMGLTRLVRLPRRCSTSARTCFSYSNISGSGGAATSSGPRAMMQWPFPGERTAPWVDAFTRKSPANPVLMAERWLQAVW